MKRIFSYHGLVFLGLTYIVLSCSDSFIESNTIYQDELPKNEVSSLNQTEKSSVSYEMTGDFSGKLDITFLSSNNFTAPEPITEFEIPWETSYDIPKNIQAIGGYVNGLYADAIEGETAHLKMLLNDTLIQTVIRQADTNGMITLPLESYHLQYENPGATISKSNIGREINYQINGDYSGVLMVVYKVEDGSIENIEITTLPWEYSFTTTEYSRRASIYALGKKGIEGQEIEFSLSIDGVVIKSVSVTAEKEGTIGLLPEISYAFD